MSVRVIKPLQATQVELELKRRTMNAECQLCLPSADAVSQIGSLVREGQALLVSEAANKEQLDKLRQEATEWQGLVVELLHGVFDYNGKKSWMLPNKFASIPKAHSGTVSHAADPIRNKIRSNIVILERRREQIDKADGKWVRLV